MILTLTPNTSLDRTLVLPGFRWGETIRSLDSALGMGGKGTDASWVLGELGIPSLAQGFAAGPTGRQMEQMLQERGVETDFTWVEGDSRTNLILIDGEGGDHTTITADSLQIGEEDIQALKESYGKALPGVKSVIIGGSLPPGVPVGLYTDLVRLARESGLPVVFDSSGSGLKAGLKGRPTLIKPNQAELASLLGRETTSLQEVYLAARDIQEVYGCLVIATLGAEGALVVTEKGALVVEPPRVELKSGAGAGDAVLAGAAHALGEGLPLEEGLRLGFAAAAAVLETLATADCKRETVEAYLNQVGIHTYSP